MSELRVLELLEGLCDSMLDYEFAASPATNDTPAQWQWVKVIESKLIGWTRLEKPEKLTRRVCMLPLAYRICSFYAVSICLATF